MCSGGVSHSISVVADDGDGFLQVGWRYYAGDDEPMGYCERSPASATGNPYRINEFEIPNKLSFYNYRLDLSGPVWQWECRIEGVTLWETSANWIGFSYGAFVPVQAEAHQDHQQLGRIAPKWAQFKYTKIRAVLATEWVPMPLNNPFVDDPVWKQNFPSTNHMQVRTDANH